MSADGNATPASSLIERDGAVETLMINDRPRNRMSLAFVGAGDKPLSEGIAAERGAVLATMGTPTSVREFRRSSRRENLGSTGEVEDDAERSTGSKPAPVP